MYSLAIGTKNDIRKDLKIHTEQKRIRERKELYTALCRMADQRETKQGL